MNNRKPQKAQSRGVAAALPGDCNYLTLPLLALPSLVHDSQLIRELIACARSPPPRKHERV